MGRLDLPMSPPAGLLNLDDPHDPVANEPFRYGGEEGVHDLSLYDGRLYMYWGPTPALVAFLPWRLVTGEGLDTAWAVRGFIMAGWLFAAVLLRQIISRFFPETGQLVRFSAFFLLGLANMAAVIVQRPSVFEVSIAAAFCFTSLAWWQLAVALWRPPGRRALPLAIASLALGLSIAARASWVVVTPLLLVALWDVRGQWGKPTFRSLLAHATVPVLTCILVLVLLNLLRFGDPFEFGQSYQLSGLRPPDELFALRHLPFSIYMYLLAPPAASDYFPFILPSSPPALSAGSVGTENVFGLLPLLPILATASLVSLTLSRHGLRNVVVLLVAVFSCKLIFLSCIHGVVLRYQLDLAPTLALLAAIGLLAGEMRWRDQPAARWSFRAVWSIALLASFVQSVAAICSLSPERSSTISSNLKSWTNSVALLSGWSRDSVIARFGAVLMLPMRIPPEKEEVLIATGSAPRTNAIYLRRPSETEVVFGFLRGDGLRVESDKERIDPTVQHGLWVELGSFYPPAEHPFWNNVDSTTAIEMRDRVRVALDGKVLIDGYAPQWGTVQAEPVLGDLPGGSTGDHRFTGVFIEVGTAKQPLR